MSENDTTNELAISSEGLIQQALSPQVIEALKREAINQNKVTFLIIQDPNKRTFSILDRPDEVCIWEKTILADSLLH